MVLQPEIHDLTSLYQNAKDHICTVVTNSVSSQQISTKSVQKNRYSIVFLNCKTHLFIDQARFQTSSLCITLEKMCHLPRAITH